MEEANISARRLAKLLHERDPSSSFDSWLRTIKRYREEAPEGEESTLPTEASAVLLADILGQPRDRYIRQQRRETVREERDRLRRENEEYRRLFGPL